MLPRYPLCIFSLVAVAGCVTTNSQVTMMQAPEVEAAGKYKSISITKFSGQGGDNVSSAIEAELINAKIQDKPVYRSVQKAGESRSLGTDSRSLASTARSLGTEAIMTGEVVSMTVHDSPYQKTEYVCDAVDKSKKYKCLSGHDEKVNCLKRNASMQVNVSLIDAQTGATVYQGAIPKSLEAEACGGAQIKSGPTMLGELKAAIVDQVKRSVVPHERTMSIAMMREDGDITSKAGRERFAGALKFAESGRMDRACETFKELWEADKRSVALNYDYGICEEAAGAFWHADELYRMADKMTNEPNKLINAALKRNGESLKKAGNLAKNRSDLLGTSKVEGGPSTAPQVVQQIIVQGGSPGNITADALLWDKRVALVIGNGKYAKSELINPPNDAVAIADELRKANFKVIKVENATLAKMNQAIEEFGRLIPKNGVALVFYAGHGMQVKGENYLIPIDADLKGEGDVPYKTINLGQVLSKLDDAKSQVNLVILDACRDNPFARSWRSTKGGLAQIDAPSGTVIAFATAPGKVASDGSGANGLYTTHLLTALRAENLKLEDVLKLTRRGVATASNNEQVPWDSSSLTGDFFFRVSKMDTVKPVTSATKSEVLAVTEDNSAMQIASRSGAGLVTEQRQPEAKGQEAAPNLGESLGGLFKSLGSLLQQK